MEWKITLNLLRKCITQKIFLTSSSVLSNHSQGHQYHLKLLLQHEAFWQVNDESQVWKMAAPSTNTILKHCKRWNDTWKTRPTLDILQLTHFSSMFYFYSLWKRQKTWVFIIITWVTIKLYLNNHETTTNMIIETRHYSRLIWTWPYKFWACVIWASKLKVRINQCNQKIKIICKS